ncbi:ribosomal RNA methyltransferase, putative [Plasmodium ovale wallikeri]|uniref:rRNA methyltransferase 2, mitochondrial n=2 Tax=Plasmodium ovale TaxID=36330 RepID=A0A1A8ZTB4_PLAOA|nr:ribosomal RNA methyltransferase, putative [Plasmodium ovale wallikeri]SBT47642.1 ribosomal RNA methyltransferase, putative [Plasmodium ovale wallikeri]
MFEQTMGVTVQRILSVKKRFLFQYMCIRLYKEAPPKVFNKKSSHSSKWIQRQITDRYVLKAKNENYRSRAAYKLIELDNKYLFLKKKKIILDIGCYPGSWCQVILERTKNYANEIIAIDKKIMDPLPNVHFIKGEIGKDNVDDELKDVLKDKKIDIILSDAAVACIGNKIDDHLNSCELTLSITNFMEQYINIGGIYIVKMYLGSQTNNLKTYLKTIFQFVNTAKPRASRSESREVYLVCRNFTGRKKINEDIQIKGAFSLKEGYY